jgi:hypothetical protein
MTSKVAPDVSGADRRTSIQEIADKVVSTRTATSSSDVGASRHHSTGSRGPSRTPRASVAGRTSIVLSTHQKERPRDSHQPESPTDDDCADSVMADIRANTRRSTNTSSPRTERRGPSVVAVQDHVDSHAAGTGTSAMVTLKTNAGPELDGRAEDRAVSGDLEFAEVPSSPVMATRTDSVALATATLDAGSDAGGDAGGDAGSEQPKTSTITGIATVVNDLGVSERSLAIGIPGRRRQSLAPLASPLLATVQLSNRRVLGSVVPGPDSEPSSQAATGSAVVKGQVELAAPGPALTGTDTGTAEASPSQAVAASGPANGVGHGGVRRVSAVGAPAAAPSRRVSRDIGDSTSASQAGRPGRVSVVLAHPAGRRASGTSGAPVTSPPATLSATAAAVTEPMLGPEQLEALPALAEDPGQGPLMAGTGARAVALNSKKARAEPLVLL